MTKPTKEGRLIHGVMHTLSRTALHFKEINKFIEQTTVDCPARPAYKKIECLYNKAMSDCNDYLKDHFDE